LQIGDVAAETVMPEDATRKVGSTGLGHAVHGNEEPQNLHLPQTAPRRRLTQRQRAEVQALLLMAFAVASFAAIAAIVILLMREAIF
jgi:hypothetical protein